jgi:hypothetical protein
MKYFAVFVISLAIGFVIGILIPAPANTLVPPSATRPEFDRTSIITIAAPAESKESGPLSWSGIFAETTIFDQLYHAHRFAASLDTAQLEVMVNKAEQSDDPYVSRNIGGVFIERYVSLDPEAAFLVVSQNPGLDPRFYIPHIFTSWARNDAASALAHLSEVEEGPIKDQIIVRLMADPRVAASDAMSEFSTSLTSARRQRFNVAQSAYSDPVAAFEAALVDPALGTEKLRTLAHRWFEKDPSAALSRIASMEGSRHQQSLARYLLAQMVRHNVEGALGWASRFPDAQKMRDSVLARLARMDPVAALPYLEMEQTREQGRR